MADEGPEEASPQPTTALRSDRRPKADHAETVRLRPDLCPSLEEGGSEAAVYLDWVMCCRKGSGCCD